MYNLFFLTPIIKDFYPHVTQLLTSALGLTYDRKKCIEPLDLDLLQSPRSVFHVPKCKVRRRKDNDTVPLTDADCDHSHSEATGAPTEASIPQGSSSTYTDLAGTNLVWRRSMILGADKKM